MTECLSQESALDTDNVLVVESVCVILSLLVAVD